MINSNKTMSNVINYLFVMFLFFNMLNAIRIKNKSSVCHYDLEPTDPALTDTRIIRILADSLDNTSIQTSSPTNNANNCLYDAEIDDPYKPTPPIVKITIVGYIKNATSNQVIPNSVLTNGAISVTFSNISGTTTAAIIENSRYSVLLVPGTYTRTITLNGFITSTEEVVLTSSSDEVSGANTATLSPIVQGWRASLRWGSRLRDLDFRVTTQTGETITWSHLISNDGLIKLDTDDQNYNGTETLTIKRLTGKYVLSAISYSGETISLADAVVTLYKGDKQMGQIRSPNKEGIQWNICEIDIDNGTFNIINTTQSAS